MSKSLCGNAYEARQASKHSKRCNKYLNCFGVGRVMHKTRFNDGL